MDWLLAPQTILLWIIVGLALVLAAEMVKTRADLANLAAAYFVAVIWPIAAAWAIIQVFRAAARVRRNREALRAHLARAQEEHLAARAAESAPIAPGQKPYQ